MALPLDLLFADPQVRTNQAVLDRALDFAFSAGDTARVFETVLERWTVPPSTFRAESFAKDLFLAEFVTDCLSIHTRGEKFEPCKPYLLSLLSRPLTTDSDLAFRHAVLREITECTQHRTAFEHLYAELRALRTMLSAGEFSVRVDQNQRRVDILRQARQLFEHMAGNFADATSGLRRIHAFGAEAVETAAFKRVVELLELEQHLATIDLRVRVGFDGTLRSFDILGHRENRQNAFFRSWPWRTWSSFLMWVRGYHVTRFEVLTRLLHQCFEALKPSLLPFFQLLGDMEFHLAALDFAGHAHAHGLVASLPSFAPLGERGLRLEQVYNPFLLAQGCQVRTCDVAAPPSGIVIVTGPNSGGKTRLLQAIGLCQLLGQCGFFVPAAHAELSWTHGIFASMVEHPRADEQEGRLGAELLRIRRMFEQTRRGDLVLLDELCSGTNPSEGEEIFRLVVELLLEIEPQVWLTTHFLKFVEGLEHDTSLRGLHFLQVALDARDAPTYQFNSGVAKTSLARQTAARLGVTRDELTGLVARAKG